MARVEPIPCRYDGINFRSKLEAFWYAVLTKLHFRITYEPEGFELFSIHEAEPSWRYAPDFFLHDIDCYLEVKPLKQQYSERERNSIASAYVLGYRRPTIVVLGSPIEYFAVKVTNRHKGNPDGLVITFMNSGCPALHVENNWCVNCYPDENGWPLDFCDPRGRNSYGYEPEIFSIPGAKQIWNAMQWQPPT
jgi:hypothetical protein